MSEESTDKAIEASAEPADEPADDATDAAEAAGESPAGFAEATADSERTGRYYSILSAFVPNLAIILAVIATLIAGLTWWQYRQFYVSLRSQDATLATNLEDTRASLRRLDDAIESVRSGLADTDADSARLNDAIEAFPAELRALGRRVEALQGGRLDARDVWLREQAMYYLVLANTELGLARRVPTAVRALGLADDVLRDLGDPGLADVRAAIAAELQALKSVELPDLEGLSVTLATLGDRVSELPLRAGAPANFGAPGENLDEVEPGLGRLWARTKGALTSIVRVERQNEPADQALSEAERRVARRQLELELLLARTALREQRQGDFRASLMAADGMLAADFNRSAQSIVEARRLLADMQKVELEPRLPDISDSLVLLRNGTASD